MKSIFGIMLILTCMTSLTTRCEAQAPVVQIGEKVPDFNFENIYNASYSRLSLDKLKDKIVILDFWGPSCGACIKKMPLMAKLQALYKDDLQIMMVTNYNLKDIQKFYTGRKELRNLGLPTVTDDQFFKSLFPYNSNPHVVWIGKDRIVKAITSGDEVSMENIDVLIRTSKLNLPVKKDIIEFDYNSPSLLTNGSIVVENVLTSSTLTNGIPGTRGFLGIIKSNDLIGIRSTNATIMGLYTFAYQKNISLSIPDYKFKVVATPEKAKLLDSLMATSRMFGYELLLSSKLHANVTQSDIQFYMQKDLDRLFSLKTSVKNIERECYIISPIGHSDSVKTVKSRHEIKQYLDSTRLTNVSLPIFISTLQSAYPFEGKLLYEGPNDSRITATLLNRYESLEDLRKILKSLGYNLSREFRMLPCLIFE